MQYQITEKQARQDLLDVARLCYMRGYITGTEGNFSIRLSEDSVLTTATGTCKGRILPSDLVITDLEGVALTNGKPSTELKMHLLVYNARPDVLAVVHAHPTVAVGFTVAGVSLSTCVLPEVVCSLGRIPTAEYATPSTDEVPNSLTKWVADYDAIMLDHHGALCMGSDIFSAFYKLETVEHYAQTMLTAHLLGGVKPLYASDVQKLINICGTYGFKTPPYADEMLRPPYSVADLEQA